MASHLNQPHFQDVTKAREYLEAIRWTDGAVCPHCGSVSHDHYALKGKAHRPGLWKCKDCREQFSVTVGTVFERSKIKLNVWLQAVFLLCSSKKGMSSHQLHRTLGVTYKTAWFMTHRIREAMRAGSLAPMGGGGKTLEADETYVFQENPKITRGKHGGAMKQMNKVVALVERSGPVRSIHVTDVTGPNLKAVLTANIAPDTHVMTDASPRYSLVKHENPFLSYRQINHSKKIYAVGDLHTNTVEGVFSILKRGLIGTFHHVSSHHLHRYLSEFDFRYNNRAFFGIDDTERTEIALRQIAGKRLTYRPINATEAGLTPKAH